MSLEIPFLKAEGGQSWLEEFNDWVIGNELIEIPHLKTEVHAKEQ